MITRATRTNFGGAALAVLLCSVSNAALAQAVATAPQAASGVSQEQALALTARLDALEQQNSDLQAQIADLKAAMAGGEQQIRDTVNSQPKVTLAAGRPTIASPDGANKIALRSVVQFDAANYQITPLRADNDLGSGTNFRRARLGFEGTADRVWNYALWAEFGGTGGESTVLNQAYIEYAGLRPLGDGVDFRIRTGAWAAVSGLEDATSNTEGLFLERAAAAEMIRGLDAGDGRSGLGFTASAPRWFAAATLTGKVAGVPASAEFDQQSGYVVRAAFSPLHGADYDVHLGGTLQGIIQAADVAAGPLRSQQIRLRERPEIRVDGNRLVDTGAINAAGLNAYGLEAGASFKSLYAAGEWFKFKVNRTNVNATTQSPFDPEFGGWYLQGAWTLTGERHVWNSANGGFRGIRPARSFNLENGAFGAFEVAARYSLLDLNDREGVAGSAAPLGGVRGGEQKITTLGLNWYPNSVLRFLLDYQHARVNRLNAAGANIGERVNVVSLRSQFAF